MLKFSFFEKGKKVFTSSGLLGTGDAGWLLMYHTQNINFCDIIELIMSKMVILSLYFSLKRPYPLIILDPDSDGYIITDTDQDPDRYKFSDPGGSGSAAMLAMAYPSFLSFVLCKLMRLCLLIFNSFYKIVA